MAKQTGVLVDDARLHPRDNSGGPMGPKKGGDFGGGGTVIGGEANESGPAANEDEFKAGQNRGDGAAGVDRKKGY